MWAEGRREGREKGGDGVGEKERGGSLEMDGMRRGVKRRDMRERGVGGEVGGGKDRW